MNQAQKPPHPGQFVREKVLKPRKLTVADAARFVGVGRQAFSAFLNVRAAVTAEMAARIEVAFEVDSQELLRMQAEFDTFEARASGVSAVTAALTFKKAENDWRPTPTKRAASATVSFLGFSTFSRTN